MRSMTFSFSHEVSPSVCFCACSAAQRGLATLHMLSGRIGPVAVVSDSAVLGFSLLGDSLFPLLKCVIFWHSWGILYVFPQCLRW